MKNYVVGLISFFENDIKLLKITAESPYEAVKIGMVEVCSEEYKQDEINWQSSEDYPKDYDSLLEMLLNSDYEVEVIEI